MGHIKRDVSCSGWTDGSWEKLRPPHQTETLASASWVNKLTDRGTSLSRTGRRRRRCCGNTRADPASPLVPLMLILSPGNLSRAKQAGAQIKSAGTPSLFFFLFFREFASLFFFYPAALVNNEARGDSCQTSGAPGVKIWCFMMDSTSVGSIREGGGGELAQFEVKRLICRGFSQP